MSERGVIDTPLDVLVGEIADLRPLPPVAARVLAIVESEHFSAHELAQAISSDPALTATVLHLANSAYYGFPRRISTVRDAVVLLGFRAIRSATLAACVLETMPRGRVIQHDAFWRFSLTVGLLAETLAKSGRCHADEAFTAGVLHNVGRLALDQARPDDLRRCVVLARQEGVSLPEAQRALLGFADAEVGGALARRWNFPPSLAQAVASHQQPLDALESGESLAGLVIRAREFALAHGLTDGLEQPALAAPAVEWTVPPLAPLLEQGGGLDGLSQRAAVFIHTASGS